MQKAAGWQLGVQYRRKQDSSKIGVSFIVRDEALWTRQSPTRKLWGAAAPSCAGGGMCSLDKEKVQSHSCHSRGPISNSEPVGTAMHMAITTTGAIRKHSGHFSATCTYSSNSRQVKSHTRRLRLGVQNLRLPFLRAKS